MPYVVGYGVNSVWTYVERALHSPRLRLGLKHDLGPAKPNFRPLLLNNYFQVPADS